MSNRVGFEMVEGDKVEMEQSMKEVEGGKTKFTLKKEAPTTISPG